MSRADNASAIIGLVWVVCLAIGVKGGAAGAAASDRVIRGLEVSAAEPAQRAVLVSPGSARIAGHWVALSEPTTLAAPPPPKSAVVTDEPLLLGDEPPQAWAHGTRLPGVQWRPGATPVPGCLDPDSVAVASAPRSQGERYLPGRDYLLDPVWGALGRVADRRIPPGATVYVSYRYSLRRIDTVALSAEGRLSIVAGKPARAAPEPPRLPPAMLALANIYWPYRATALTPDQIYPIRDRRPVDDRGDPCLAHFVPRTLARLRAIQTVTVVALGDSVTVGGDASTPDRRFPDLFAESLRGRFPGAGVVLVNAGVGGTNSDYGLERLDRDVLAHAPDLVVIEFVNDMGMSPQKIAANYAQLVSRIRAVHADIIILTPHYTMPEWMGEGRRQAEDALRTAAREHGVGLGDAAAEWARLRERGLPDETLLNNGINHPDDRGHAIYARVLMRFFPR
jgi:lysophospholipase L1-like esterase